MSAKLMTLPRRSRKLGFLPDHEKYFEKEKQKMFARYGDLSDLRLTYGRILIAQWYAEDAPTLASGQKGIILPDDTADNEKWTSLTGLVLKMGPHAYEDNEHIKWFPEEVASVGDWVMYRQGDGLMVRVWDHICTLCENEHAIRAIISRPDIV